MRNTTNKMLFITGYLVFFLVSVYSCSGNPFKTDKETDTISGLYELEGIQINEFICTVGCIPEYAGQIMRSDTFHVSFPVEISIVENRKDTLYFSGLEGADQRIRHLDSNRNTTNPEWKPRSHVSECTYARLNQEKIVFDLLTPSGAYTGEGTLTNGEISIQTNYYYRGTSVDYILSGRKQ